jgi:hypothetical protein
MNKIIKEEPAWVVQYNLPQPNINREKLIKKYVVENQGELYRITTIQVIRDGGTRVIETNKKDIEYYIHKKNGTIHKSYPRTDTTDLVTNENELEYLREQIEVYIDRCKWDIQYGLQVLEKMKQNEKES